MTSFQQYSHDIYPEGKRIISNHTKFEVFESVGSSVIPWKSGHEGLKKSALTFVINLIFIYPMLICNQFYNKNLS